MKKIKPGSGSASFRDMILPELDSRALKRDPIMAEQRLNALSLDDQTRAVLQRSGAERLDLILLSRRARSLVRRMPDMEWYLTIKQVGDDDSLPLLALANPAKLTFLFDLEWWHKDILDPLLVIHWINILMESDQEKVEQWLKAIDPELLLLLLSKFMRVFKTDPDDEGNEPWRALPLFTLDNTYYFHFLDQNLDRPLEKFVRILRDMKGVYFYPIMDDLSCTVPAELEEAAGHFRSRRMDEYGFPDFDEAFAIYAFLSPQEIQRLIEESKKWMPDTSSAAPRYPLALPDMPRLISLALERIDSQEALETIQFDLARLSNRVLVADALDLSRLENIDRAVKKVMGYIETGLEVLAEGDTDRAAGLLSEKPLQMIFQAGYSQALRMHYRAGRLMREGWPRQVESPFSLLGSVDGPLFEAILKPRPLYSPAPGEKGETGFREFESMAEIRRCEKALDRAGVFGPFFFEALGINKGDLEDFRSQRISEVTWASLLCTAFVKTLTAGLFSFGPISINELERFIKEMMTPAPPRRIKNEPLDNFIAWLSRRLVNLGPATIAAIMEFVRESLEAMEQELEKISPQDLDPRFIQTLIVKKDSDHLTG